MREIPASGGFAHRWPAAASRSFVQYTAQDWANEPFIGQAYLNDFAEPWIPQALAAPLGDRVFFAGDAYTRHDDWGGVDDATRSARDAVAQIPGIAAVSIGIGISFAIHFIARYRQELARHGTRSVAVRIAGEGTGLALVASAVSSAVGFGILALAPMPLFAAYGLLTALMILMALVATLAVLPALLVAITSDRVEAPPSGDAPPEEPPVPAASAHV